MAVIELTMRGPLSSTDNALVRFDGTAGWKVQNSGVTVDDSNNVAGVVGLTMSGALSGLTNLTMSGSISLNGLILQGAGATNDFLVVNSAGSNVFHIPVAGTNVRFYAAPEPSSNDGASIGTASRSFSDVFIASGGVINWNNGDYTITHSTGNLTFSGTLTAGATQIGSTAPTASQGSALVVNSSVTTGAAGSGSIIVQGEANKERIKIYSAGGQPVINLFSFRGSIASPSATQAGDVIAGVSGGGYGSTAFSGSYYAFFQCAAENWTDSAMGTYTVFNSVPNGTTGAVARILIANDGTITFGSAFNTGTGALYAGTAVFTTASTSLTGISLTHSGVIAAGQDGVLINCTGANTNANSSALYVLQSNASSTQITARFTNLGSSHAASLISASGATLLSTQNTITSTNFVKHFQWTKVGGGVVTLWISNGTDPNGVLSGTAGDVCFNCNSSLIKKCTGTTNWS